ncbi:MAG TPA: transketolase [Rhodopila sp.]|uniref:transketolase n=1 Tax=Rhodopila sp. TaxID=2480087 RepID=UPI002C41AC54|nr:transketolase [Rhodopila sp.]HVY15396.1 transketolase [Rhodopila sp.]
MADIVGDSPEIPILARQADILSRPVTVARRMADAIRALAIDATQQSNSGHPGLPMGMADVATVLWTRFHKFDAADPHWPDRDRFVLSAGHGSLLLYALIYLTGHAHLTIDDIRNFRQLHSPAAGHPEFGAHPAIETTTGPLGQGISTAVGMALAERNMAARFGKSLVDHRTWVIASDGDLMEGVSHEAAALAGHLGLNKLTVLYDDNHVSIDGDTALAYSDDVLKRFAGYGWAAKRVDGHDPAQVQAALSFAMRSKKPTLIACSTIIGLGAPTKAGTHAVHGAPLGEAEAAAARRLLGWTEPPFETPHDLQERWHAVGGRGASARRAWLKRLARHSQRAEFERVLAGRLPDTWHETIAALKQDIAETQPRLATRASSQKCLEALVPAIPELIGGSADLTGSNLTQARGMTPLSVGNYGGRYVHYGVREHGMAAAANGLALHGGIIPYIGTFFVFSDYLRPALRMGAIMRQRVVYVLTHDSIGLGEDGPTHQPVEHLASLRAMPNIHVMRPADAMETAECWELALRRADGPSLLVLSRQGLPALRTDAGENRCARGGYVLAEAEGPRQATLVATGSEVAIAMAAREMLAADGVMVAVVSLPCWELFALQDETYRTQVLGGAPRIGIEAAGDFGWERWLGPDGVFIGLHGFGASAKYTDLYAHFGLTPEAVKAAVTRRLAGP